MVKTATQRALEHLPEQPGEGRISQPESGEERSLIQGMIDRFRKIDSNPAKVTVNTLDEMSRHPTVRIGLGTIDTPIMSAFLSAGIPALEGGRPVVREAVRMALQDVLPHVIRHTTREASKFPGAFGELEWIGPQTWNVPVGDTTENVRAWKMKYHPLRSKGMEVFGNRDGTFHGIRQRGGQMIPAEKAVAFSWDPEPDSPLGVPPLAYAHLGWFKWMLTHLLEGRWVERKADPTLIGRYPKGRKATDDGSAQKDPAKRMLSILRALRSSGVVALPDDVIAEIGEFAWQIEELSIDDRGTVFGRILEYYDKVILRSFLVPERTVVEGIHGTKAEAEVHTDRFLSVANDRLWRLADFLRRHVVAKFVHFTFGPDEVVPSFRPIRLEPNASAVLSRILYLLISQEPAFASSIDLESVIRQLAIPLLPPERRPDPHAIPVDDAANAVLDALRRGEDVEDAVAHAFRKAPRAPKPLASTPLQAFRQRTQDLMREADREVDEAVAETTSRIEAFEGSLRLHALRYLTESGTLDDEGAVDGPRAKGNLRSSISKMKKGTKAFQKLFSRTVRGRTVARRTYEPMAAVALRHAEAIARHTGATWDAKKAQQAIKGTGVKLESLAPIGITVFLENIARIADRNLSQIRELLAEGAGAARIADAISKNSRAMNRLLDEVLGKEISTQTAPNRTLAERLQAAISIAGLNELPLLTKEEVEDAIGIDDPPASPTERSSMGGWTARGDVPERLPLQVRVRAGVRDSASAIAREMGEAFDAAIAIAFVDAEENELAYLQKVRGRLTRAVHSRRWVLPDRSLVGDVSGFSFHRGITQATSEAPARTIYRETLAAIAAALGWDVWIHEEGPRTTERGGEKSAVSLRYIGILATLEWWRRSGEAEGAPEPINSLGLHFGEGDYFFPIPDELVDQISETIRGR